MARKRTNLWFGAAALGGGLLLTACNTGNSDDRFAVGSDGLIIASTTGGSTWTPQNSKTGNDLDAVSFVDPSNGCAVGENATVVRTSDAGSHWNKAATVPTEENLRSVDVNQGISFGGGPLITGEAAKAAIANRVNSDTITFPIYGVAVGDNGLIISTTDGCNHWTKQTSGTTRDLKGVAMDRNGSKAWAVGQHGVILTNKTGPWMPRTSGTTHDLRGVCFANPNGWTVGEHGVILRTSNGGTTWTAQSSGVTTRLNSVSFNGLEGYAVGDDGVILHTTNGGSAWTAQSSGTDKELRSVSTVHGWDAVVVGDHGTVLTTSNNGTTWTSHSSGTTKTLRGAV
jgi:photosystem II stability/assembly factor-like uncharacterized protein